MNQTSIQYDQIIENCRKLFILKMKDYGPSWRVFRLKGITEQLYIKTKNIRQQQETGVSLVGDTIIDNLTAIVNYGVIAIIQSRNNYADVIDMTNQDALLLYNQIIDEAKQLMTQKNHDYGEAWRQMSVEGITDMIFAKIIRIKTILQNQGITLASEGVEGNFFDIINYAIFNLIHLTL
ncbi:MAG: DUF1599 domain-containing protein [Paludibacteraceae bacterium]|nr:DUF1599 domain-containing protein [Paludibacteraceae bacterium]